MISVSGVTKTYGSGAAARRILDGADLSVPAGQLLAVVGRSGSGKSTLLHLLGALDTAEAGRIEVAGQRVDGRSERQLARFRREKVGFVFQAFHLLPELTGAENVLLAAQLPGSGRGAARRGVQLIERLGLSDAARRRPAELSGGEQQRLAIARALVHDAPVLLADEPTGNLDAAAGEIVLGVLGELAAEGRTVVVVTHEQTVTERADRVVTMQDGLLVDQQPARPAAVGSRSSAA